MFNIGDKVVYPNHGAGTIVGIESKNILGKENKYYIMKLPIGEMKAMVPVDKVEEIGLRNVISSEEADEVLDLLRDGRIKMSHNWNKRFRTNMEKIKSGDIFEVAKVVRNLTIREDRKSVV